MSSDGLAVLALPELVEFIAQWQWQWQWQWQSDLVFLGAADARVLRQGRAAAVDLLEQCPPTSASLPRMAVAESVVSVMSCSSCDQWLHLRSCRSNGKQGVQVAATELVSDDLTAFARRLAGLRRLLSRERSTSVVCWAHLGGHRPHDDSRLLRRRSRSRMVFVQVGSRTRPVGAYARSRSSAERRGASWPETAAIGRSVARS